MYIKVYFILAHKNPTQIRDLITLLDDKKSLFFIHIDKKSNEDEYKIIIENSSCHFIKKRISCSWGKYNLVQATLNAMKEVQYFMSINYKTLDYHFIMMSGEDLPLKNNSFIHEFLENKIKTSFINYWELPYEKWWDGGLFRFKNLYFFQYKKYPKLNYWTNKIIKKMHLNFLFPLNKFNKQFPDFKIFGASQWMILNKNVLQFVLEKNKEIRKFNSIFKYVLAPDELYFASLILNYDVQKQFSIENLKTHLVCFSGVEVSPKYLQVEDIDNNREDLLFARKFDSNINQSSIDKVKKIIAQ